MKHLEKQIFLLSQAIAAILLTYNIQTIPVDSKYINHPKILKLRNNVPAIKNMLTHMQLMIYNVEINTGKKHNYSVILTDFMFKFYKLKKII